MNLQEFAQAVENQPYTRLDCLFDDSDGKRRIEKVDTLNDIAYPLQQDAHSNVQLRWRYEGYGEIHLAFTGALYICEKFLSSQQATAWAFCACHRQKIGSTTHGSLTFSGNDILKGSLALTGRAAPTA